ncbi:MAG: histidinol dehydrogenase [Planctomycetes bacterium]|nr:histidinol dehydrogenase [Planctomycetota bacterium]MBL7105976.1 histidinol dehydrogenase [Phycisphaerae bacterium]
MEGKLENILISYKQDDFNSIIGESHGSMAKMAKFGPAESEFNKVIDIISDIFKAGKGDPNESESCDDVVAKYTEEFDGVKLSPEQFLVTGNELKKAHAKIEIDKELLSSIRKAIANVRKYQNAILNNTDETFPDDGTGIKYTPIERVGICVPGASAPLPSTVIMTAVPAQVAGVKEIAVISPPRYNGTIHPVTLAVCHELEISEVYRIGGVQAVAALARGTEHISKVDKIVGPGNKWVQTAKQLVLGLVGIDSIAGPSEVLIIANDEANPAWIAADMLSQAEHAPGCAFVFTDSQKLGKSILEELKKQAKRLSRSKETIECLTNYSKIAVFENMTEVISLANDFAAEHLQIQCGDESGKYAEQITNAGAIFVGAYSPVAVGDYFAGPSHTLPTGTSAKFFSPLSSNDFVKSTSIIEYSKEMLERGAEKIIRLANTEGLDAHAKSIEVRKK